MGSTGHYEDNTVWSVSRFIGSDPTQILPPSLAQGKGVVSHRRDLGRDATELDYQLNWCFTARPVRATSIPAGYGLPDGAALVLRALICEQAGGVESHVLRS